MASESIDITPTWRAILPGLIATLTNNEFNPDGTVNRDALDARLAAVGELGNMARAADMWNAHARATAPSVNAAGYNPRNKVTASSVPIADHGIVQVLPMEIPA